MNTFDNNNKLVIVGDGAFAEVACEYFQTDSEFEVVAFAVEKSHWTKKHLLDLPVILLEDIEDFYPPSTVKIYCAVGYGGLNTHRDRLLTIVKGKKYKLASFISTKASIARNVLLGEHLFILENNVIQPFSKIHDNVILWSGNHIGHHSRIHKNVFISSHVVISGSTQIKRNSFLGVNSTISNNLVIEKFNWVGPGVLLQKSTKPYEIWKHKGDFSVQVSTKKFFNLGDIDERS